MPVLAPATAKSLTAALAGGRPQLVAALNDLFLALPGARVVTWLYAFPDEKITRRIGTSDPVHFPTTGFDPIDDGAWCRRIYGEKLPIVGNSPAEMGAYIPETGELEKLGYGATLCMPIVISGVARGTVNVLGAAGIFTPAFMSELATLMPLAALVFAQPA